MTVAADATLPPVRAVVFDFDGTLVTADLLDELCGLQGREGDSRALNEKFIAGQLSGIGALVERINMLTGLSLQRLYEHLDANLRLTPGAAELCAFLGEQQIVTVIASGSILPVLEHYQRVLGIDHVLGPRPYVRDGVLAGMDERNSPPEGFKLLWARQLIDGLGIAPSEVVAIGDSPSERGLFAWAGTALAIHPKGGIEHEADVVLPGTLLPVRDLILQRAG